MSTTFEPTQRGPGEGLGLQQALAEAQRCLLCHDAPCSGACPGGTDPGRFIRQIRFYNLKGAARTVLGNNPLGGVCAYICPTSDTCVQACLRAGLDRPIDIAGLQRFAVDYGRAAGVKTLERGEPNGLRVAIVGGGPAGLTAATQLARKGYGVTVFEARPEPGGMLRYGIPASRLGKGPLEADLAEIRELGVELRTGTPIDGKDGAAALLADGYRAVFVAPGLWKARRLPLPGAALEGVDGAIAFLERTHTAPDRAAAQVAGKNVAIIGGGSVAMDVARCARELGAGRIYAIALEAMTELPAMASEVEDAIADGVIFKPQCRVTQILGRDGRVSGVEGVEIEWIEPGRLVPDNARPIDNTFFRLNVGAVIQAIGQGPTEEIGRILTAAGGVGALLRADAATQETPVARIFAGGDIVRGAGTVVEAVADGKRAARAIDRLLSGAAEEVV